MKLRPYQQKAQEKAHKYWKKGRSFRLNMCVGAGKTFTSISIVESLPDIQGKTVIAMFHANNLKNQFEKAVKDFGKTKAKWKFTTYHSLKQNAHMYDNVEVLIADEAHQGGLSKAEGCHASIIDSLNPPKILCLTATDYNLDKNIYEEKHYDNTYIYSYNDGLQQGFVNEADIITIHTGLNQDVENDIDYKHLSADNIDELVRMGKKEGVDFSCEESYTSIEKARLVAAISVYFDKEAGEKAIFFVKTRSLAEEGARLFNEAARKAGQSLVAKYTHSLIPNSLEIISDFCNKRFDVLFSVKQIQEGFNYPELAVGFDLSPSVSNEARALLQKLGRITRKSPEKQMSRYYIMLAAPCTNRKFSLESAAANSQKAPEFEEMTEEQKEILEENFSLMADIKKALVNESDENIPEEQIEISLDLKKPEIVNQSEALAEWIKEESGIYSKKVIETQTVSNKYIVTKAEGHNVSSTKKLSFLLSQADDRPWLLYKTAEDLALWVKENVDPKNVSDWQERHPPSYAYAKGHYDIKKIKKLLGFILRDQADPEERFLALLEWSEKNGKRPSQIAKCPIEKGFGKFLASSSVRKRPDLLAEYEKRFPKQRILTYEFCSKSFAQSQKENITWVEYDGAAYQAAVKKKWLKRIYKENGHKQKFNSLTYEVCLECAKEAMKKNIAFKHFNGSAYGKARRMGWLEDICKQIDYKIEPVRSKNNKVYCPQTKKTYKNFSQASKDLGVGVSTISTAFKSSSTGKVTVKGYDLQKVD